MTLSEISERAAILHEGAIVIDAHSDILMAVTDGRVRLGERTVVDGVTTRDVYGHYDLPRWLEGGMTAQVCALFISNNWMHAPMLRAMDMIAAAYREIAENELLMLATSTTDIRKAKKEGKVALILSFEGADPLVGSLKYLPLFHRLGVRMASLVHARRNYFAGGVCREMDESMGLTPLGVEAIRMMNELGIVVDLRHLDYRAIEQILEISSRPLVMSHVNARKAFVVDTQDGPHYPFTAVTGLPRRHLMSKIGVNGGVVCTIFWRQKDIEDLVDDIVYVSDAIGPEHAGLGSDLYGFDTAPPGAEDVTKLPYVTERLVQRGFSDNEIRGILGGNLMRVFEQVWQ